MASVTTSTVPIPPEVLAKPAARVLSESLGDNVLSIEDFRGDLAITVERKAWVEAARLLRDTPSSTTSSSSTSAASTSSTARTARSASRSCCTSTRSPTSTTSG